MPRLIVGLGNPGPRYADNRHNIGFMVADAIVARMGERYERKHNGELARGRLGGVDVLVLKPLTYMNLSGTSVAAAFTSIEIPLEHVIVVHDELDLPFEQVRVKAGGGHAGHNGLRSIFDHLGAALQRDAPDGDRAPNGFIRVRCGIGRPSHGDISSHVLSDFSADERITLATLIDDAADAVELVVTRGPLEAMNTVHPQQKKKAVEVG